MKNPELLPVFVVWSLLARSWGRLLRDAWRYYVRGER